MGMTCLFCPITKKKQFNISNADSDSDCFNTVSKDWGGLSTTLTLVRVCLLGAKLHLGNWLYGNMLTGWASVRQRMDTVTEVTWTGDVISCLVLCFLSSFHEELCSQSFSLKTTTAELTDLHWDQHNISQCWNFMVHYRERAVGTISSQRIEKCLWLSATSHGLHQQHWSPHDQTYWYRIIYLNRWSLPCCHKFLKVDLKRLLRKPKAPEQLSMDLALQQLTWIIYL